MSKSSNSSDSGDFGGGAAGSIVVFALVIAVMVMARLVIYIIKTFVRYHEEKVLWIALAVNVGLSILSLLLYWQFNADWCYTFAALGFVQLLIICFVVELRNRDTLPRENVSMINSVLKSSWWDSEDTPIQEQEREQVAA